MESYFVDGSTLNLNTRDYATADGEMRNLIQEGSGPAATGTSSNSDEHDGDGDMDMDGHDMDDMYGNETGAATDSATSSTSTWAAGTIETI
ncbi:hypothetical protein MKZ38_008969 [Zalerion maritima]|uniref:Uncharacterized protein n=1 Tax=Zalerion maritima TaxID=339359 RepID=A0AAD5RUZ8_9PEZI|nr:hypothetical protein MKZ38_008969 [Zalerion maritima]